MTKKIGIFLLTYVLGFGLVQNSRAELFDVSPDLTVAVLNTIPAGFPVWYQDFADPAASPDANPNYGINAGPTAPGGLTLEICPDLNVDPFCISDIAGGESFWWSTEALLPTSAGQALLVLAVEGVPSDVDGTPVVFGRIRIRVDTPVAGTYTVTHPFGVQVFQADAGIRGINFTEDLGCDVAAVNAAAPCNFALTLASNIGPFLFWDADLPLTDGAGNFYAGDPRIEHRILGSPIGNNFFRIDGPPGSGLGGAGIDFVETDLFAVSGKVFTVGGNTAPAAVADAAATLAGTAVDIDVIANDTFTDIPIAPSSMAFPTPPTGGTVAMAVVDGKVKARYTPNANFTGPDTFSYTVAGFGGAVSTPATVTVMVEDLKVTSAEFRPKFLKWRITGTSSDVTANSIGVQAGPPTVSATLSGDQENPPIVSTGSGQASVAVGDASIDFTLSITGLLSITATHLHLGGPGADGPVIFLLAGPNVTNASGTLTAANLPTPLPAGITSFADVANAILSGNAYVQVHTQARPAGEIRGQLGPNRIVGTAAVQGTAPVAPWVFDGKSNAFPDENQTISVRSSNGVQVINVPVKIK